MVRIKISEFTKANFSKFGDISSSIVQALTDNPAFPDLPVPVETVVNAIAHYKSLVANVLQTGSFLDLNARNYQRQIVTSYLLDYAQHVEYKIRYAADPEKLAQSAGMSLAKQGGKRLKRPFEAPGNVRVKPTALPGCLELRWKPVPGCRSYIIERCLSENAEGDSAIWAQVATSTKASCRVLQLPSAQYAVLRVRAANSYGLSYPSAAVRCIVG